MVKKRLLFCFLAFIFLSGCAQPLLFKETRILMDTFSEISCYTNDKERVIEAMADAFDEMKRIEGVFSKYDKASEVSKINEFAGKGEVRISREVFELIERSIYYSRISEGGFDITVEPLLNVWNRSREANVTPDNEIIEETLKCVGYRNIILNNERLSIRFLNKDTKIDLGGIAKGYAVDRAKEILLSHGINDALIDIGGNIYALGIPPGKKSWKVGIQHPRDKNALVDRLELKDRAISTSGDYERFFILDGKRYSHIMEPTTGRPAEGVISVTIVANTAEQADALSTAVFVMGVERGLKLVRSIEDGTWVFIWDDKCRLIKYP